MLFYQNCRRKIDNDQKHVETKKFVLPLVVEVVEFVRSVKARESLEQW